MERTGTAEAPANGAQPPGAANAPRGSVFIIDAQGRRREISLNMQVLAYVASATDIRTIGDLMRFATNPDIAQVAPFIAALLRGNGIEVDEAALARRLDLSQGVRFIQHVIEAVNAAMPGEDDVGNGVALSLMTRQSQSA